jgi:PAS domain S-box-containing protein
MALRWWQLGWKATIGYLVVALAILAGGWAAVHQVRAARMATGRARQTLAVLRQIGELEIVLLSAETGQRGYVLTGEEPYLDPYKRARESVRPTLDRLKKLVSDTPSQRERLDQVGSLAEAKLAEMKQTVELRQNAGIEAATNVVNTHVGKGLMTRILSILGDLRAEETALLNRQSDQRSQGFWWAGRVALAGSGLALIAVALATLGVNGGARRRPAVARSLRESEERLRVTLRSIGDAVIATDARSDVVFMNHPAEALTGWTEDAARGRPLDEIFHIVNEHTRAPVRSPAARVLREGRVVGLATHTLLLSREGTETPIDDSGAPIRDAGGEMMGVVLVFRDITDRKRQEEEHGTLLREEAARAVAERESRTKDEFLAILSHELRSPLQGILGWLTVLREMRPEPAQQQRALQAIERGVRQQTQLVNDILDVSRIVAGKLQLEREAVDLAAVVEECVDQAVPETRVRALDLESDVTQCGVVLGDRHRLRQSVTNLLANAIKFTPSGGRIVVRCHREAGDVVVTVQDSGQGIAPEFLANIFDRFTQADAGPRPSTVGLGLGLSIVRQIAEVHGGSVHAYSEGLGRGATFVLRLPLAPAGSGDDAESCATVPATTRSSLDGVSILVVDDDHETRDSLALLLATRGAVVRHAGSVSEALDACAQQPPDVVISDISMPDQDGYALIDALRRLEGQGPIAVALTGFASDADRSRTAEAGFHAHISKPVDLDALVGTILDLVVARPAAV